jgi:ppGpp synthetase/RelA/SpoT-type nucleotidyltranferase
MKIARELRDIFFKASERYERLASEVRDTLKTSVEEKGWFFTSRVKKLESFALKVETGRVLDPRNLEDFFACTIVVPTTPEIAAAENFLKDHYGDAIRRPRDDSVTKKYPSSFVFDDLRLYVVRQAVPSGRNPDLEGIRFEVQIKTILQHAWSIATHDLIYKSDSVSWPRERIAYQVKAMLEHAEIAIAEASTLSNAKAIAKEDSHIAAVRQILGALDKIWTSDRLPTDVKRLAETVSELFRTCRLSPDRFEEIVDAEIGRVGTLPTDLSPYSFIVQAIAHVDGQDLRRHLDKGRSVVVIHRGMDLPDWMWRPNEHIIQLGESSAPASSQPA